MKNIIAKIDWAQRTREIATLTAISLFLAIIKPFNATAQIGMKFAFIYWLLLIMVGAISGEFFTRVLSHYFPKLHVAIAILITSLLVAINVTAAMVFIENQLGPNIPMSYLARIYAMVWVISVAMTSFGFIFNRAFKNSSQFTENENTMSDSSDAFLSRLPIKFQGSTLYGIVSEDHYLRVFTSVGDTLILMRLSDAVRELASTEGFRTHRSWWVARAGIDTLEKKDGKLQITLKSGQIASVSKTYRPALLAAGWLN